MENAHTPELRLVYVTAPSKDDARRLAALAIRDRLAACANILPGIESLYWWEGEVATDEEVVLILKTRADLVEKLSNRLTEAHTYDCPCVVALKIEDGHPPFLNWIEAETRADE